MDNTTITDVFNIPIQKGKIYGYTQYSNGVFTNSRIIIIDVFEKAGKKFGDKKSRVTGFAAHDGSFVYNNNNKRTPEMIERVVSVYNTGALFPLPENCCEIDECCRILKERYHLKFGQ